MAVFSYQQNTTVLEPITYQAQIKENRHWWNIGGERKTYGAAVTALVKYQRRQKGMTSGRILALGVVSQQTYSNRI